MGTTTIESAKVFRFVCNVEVVTFVGLQLKSLIGQCIYKKTSSVHCSSSTVYYYPCDTKCDHLGLGAGYGHIKHWYMKTMKIQITIEQNYHIIEL